ncbi:unnamed protein product [Blepharisma stoltei]|uniref:Maltase n=1 Tax=Blepharisma stoltei TaxID=1481888 RepID=A0AAU9K066_9CILI|nr:unnamed protein product [Blepharisma stoltei]
MAKISNWLIFLILISTSTQTYINEDILKECQVPYTVKNITRTSQGIVAYASFNPSSKLISDQNKSHTIQKLTINITYETSERVRIQIKDTEHSRWEVPKVVVPYNQTTFEPKYDVMIDEDPLGILIIRKSDGKVIFNLDPNSLFSYNDQDIAFFNILDYDIKIMGFGERVSNLTLNRGEYTMWSRDRCSPIDDGNNPNGNMYSVHPFYVAIDEDFKCFGGFLLNSNAMTGFVGNSYVGYRTTGGIIDFYVFVGPTAADVVRQYQEVIGFPALAPYWSLGWHQSHWGYNNLTIIEKIVDLYMRYKLPLDSIWNDIDYMTKFEDFTLDPDRYPHEEFLAWIDHLHSLHKHYVPIIDAGIAKQNYSAYNEMIQKELYIKDPYNSNPADGVVWPGDAVFLDWFHPNTSDFWVDQLIGFYNLTEFSGIWIDMNEASNFINGDFGHPATIINSTTMPYTPGEDINTNSLDVASIHYGGILEYNVHSLYGFMETIATNRFFTENLNKRAFVLTRSSFPGHGRFGSKWTGDNYAKWEYMRYSIIGIFNFGMFGIPHVGADICGFIGDTTEELCTRWMQLGSLYPFARNHNDNQALPQEPWAFGTNMLETSNMAIRNRYFLMLYIYTEMFFTSFSGEMFFKPTFFSYPYDRILYENVINHFMLGKSLIVHPCLWKGVSRADSYFPGDIWYNFYSGARIKLDKTYVISLEMPLHGLINIHVRGGSIIPLLDSADTALSVEELRNSNITLLVALNSNLEAAGRAVFDDGISSGTINEGNYTRMDYHWRFMNYSTDILDIQPINSKYESENEFPHISNIKIYGCSSLPKQVEILIDNRVIQGSIINDPGLIPDVCKIEISNSNGNFSPNRPSQVIFRY